MTLRPEPWKVTLGNTRENTLTGTRLLFAGKLTRQPYMQGRNYRVSGTLVRSDTVMSKTFWIGVQPALTEPMLEHAATSIDQYLGVCFD